MISVSTLPDIVVIILEGQQRATGRHTTNGSLRAYADNGHVSAPWRQSLGACGNRQNGDSEGELELPAALTVAQHDRAIGVRRGGHVS